MFSEKIRVDARVFDKRKDFELLVVFFVCLVFYILKAFCSGQFSLFGLAVTSFRVFIRP